MEQRERADQRSIGLPELPQETLRAVEADREIEPVLDHEAVTRDHAPHIDGREGSHRRGLIELHRMAKDAVAEIVAPGQRRRRAIGEVLDASEIAADAA